jgi:hypothetical protein
MQGETQTHGKSQAFQHNLFGPDLIQGHLESRSESAASLVVGLDHKALDV